MENEQVYCGLDELEQAKGYLTTVIVKEHVVQ
jgi:sirohydrochlorin cobaltochelatase